MGVACDIKSVVINLSVSISMLNNKHNVTYLYRVREAQAAKIIKVGWVQSELNLKNLFTKITLSSETRRRLVKSNLNNNTTPFVKA